jgi:hypothetical protein
MKINGGELIIAPKNGHFKVRNFYGEGKDLDLPDTAAGMFAHNGKNRMVLILRKETTMHVVQHELMHFKHCKYNLEDYYKETKHWLIRFHRERYVFYELQKHHQTLNRYELVETVNYMNWVSEQKDAFLRNQGIEHKLEVFKFDFDIESIPLVRTKIDIETVLKLF